MKILLLQIFLLTGFSTSFAQVSCNIKKAYAFYNASMPGVQMVDENGNPIPVLPSYIRFIYVEYSSAKMPDIKAVIYNNEALSFTITGIKERTVSIGDKNLNPNNTITAKKGSTFLKIDLYPKDGKTMAETDYKNIIIKYKSAGKLCKFNLNFEKQFNTLPRY
jgi:hypothetical protein